MSRKLVKNAHTKVRQKPQNNPKLLMNVPFNSMYKVNQMKHNLFQPQTLQEVNLARE